MTRGGYRKGAGRKSAWKNKATTVIRVPEIFAEQLLDIAHKLDSGATLEFITKSKSKPIDRITKSKKKNDSVTKSIDQVESVINSNKGLSGVQLGKRLGCAESGVRKHRDGISKQSLEEWSQKKDPEGIAWEYRKEEKKYYRLISPKNPG